MDGFTGLCPDMGTYGVPVGITYHRYQERSPLHPRHSDSVCRLWNPHRSPLECYKFRYCPPQHTNFSFDRCGDGWGKNPPLRHSSMHSHWLYYKFLPEGCERSRSAKVVSTPFEFYSLRLRVLTSFNLLPIRRWPIESESNG